MRCFALFALALVAGCGYQIGESCIVSTDCAADGSRICDNDQPSGYCTIMGCDYNTCPENSECVSFFTGSFSNRPCVYGGDNGSACSDDELCAITNQCVPRSAEVRYCMATCSNNGDCRDSYECRTFSDAPGSDGGFVLGTMQEDGGQVVLPPGQVDSSSTQGFCAPSP